MSTRYSEFLRSVVAVGLALSSSTAALAQTEAVVTARLTPAYHACRKQAYGGTFPEAICMADENRRQDVMLNARWRRTIGAMSRVSADALRKRQREWIRSRDPRCKAEVTGQDVINSTAIYVYNVCMLDMTVRRIMFLERLG